MTWRRPNIADLTAEIAALPVTAVLFGLDDCTACQKAATALESFDFDRFRCTPLLAEFREMNPADAEMMRTLRVEVFPQMRLYARGQLLGAWESLMPRATHQDIRDFTHVWLARTLLRAMRPRPVEAAL